MSRPNHYTGSQVNVNKLPSIVIHALNGQRGNPPSYSLHPDTSVAMQTNASRNLNDGATVDSTGKTKAIQIVK